MDQNSSSGSPPVAAESCFHSEPIVISLFALSFQDQLLDRLSIWFNVDLSTFTQLQTHLQPVSSMLDEAKILGKQHFFFQNFRLIRH